MIKIDADEEKRAEVEGLGFSCSDSGNTLVVRETSVGTSLKFDELFTTKRLMWLITNPTNISCKDSILSTLNYTVLDLTYSILNELDS